MEDNDERDIKNGERERLKKERDEECKEWKNELNNIEREHIWWERKRFEKEKNERMLKRKKKKKGLLKEEKR